MRTIGRIFISDVRHITSNIASIIIVLAITVIPGLFAWFNIAASWNPFGNTGNLQFAIANEDEGYKGDLLPMKVSLGDQVVSTLRANSQLDWTFTSPDKAIDGTKSGKYYAAVIIPKNFSKTMLTFLTSDAKHATLEYYMNEKLNAIAPKVTGQGADTLTAQINESFAKTLTDIALNVGTNILNTTSQDGAQERLAQFNTNIEQLANTFGQSATALKAYAALTDSAQTLLASTNDLVGTAQDRTNTTIGELDSSRQALSDLTGALDTSVNALGAAVDNSAGAFAGLSDRIDTLFSDIDAQANTSAQGLDQLAGTVTTQANRYGQVHDQLQTILNQSNLPADSAVRVRLQNGIDQIGATQHTLNTLASQLTGAASDVRNHIDVNSQERQSIKDLAAQAKSSLDGISSDFQTTVQPNLTQMNDSFTSAASQMSASVTQLGDSLGSLDDATGNANEQLTKVRELITNSAGDLQKASERLTQFHTEFNQALSSGNMEQVRALLGRDPATLAATFSAPVQLQTHYVYPVENFGTALTPFYTFMPMWVGCLLLVVMLKITLSDKRMKELGDPKPWQEFLGHYLIFLGIAFLQATFSLAGTLLFMRVHAVHPWLFMLVGWVAALVFSFFVYTLVATFANIGKAAGVLFLVMQISGSGASYPIVVLPPFIAQVSPFLPVTYAVRAMRSAIAGIYANDYWIALGQLALFLIPLLFLGLVLRHWTVGFNRWLTEKVESTHLIG